MLRSNQEQVFESDGQEEPVVPAVQQINISSSDDVITQSLNTLSSFDYFHNASLSSFTKASYSSRRVNHSTQLESPYERFLRLKMELTELGDDLQEMQDLNFKDKQSIWNLLQEETNKLSKEADNLTRKYPFQLRSESELAADRTRLHSEILTDLQCKLEDVSKNISISSPSSSSSSSTINEKVLLGLEQRIFHLETTLGIHANYSDLQLVANGLDVNTTSAFPLVQIIHRLERKVATLDAATIDVLRSKFASFKNEVVGTTSGVAGGGNDTVMKVLDAMKKLDHLVDSVAKIDAVVDELPIILTRLKTLEGVHWNATMFANRLQQMEQEIQSMAQEVASNQVILDEIKVGLKDNLAMMEENVQKVEDRLSRCNL